MADRDAAFINKGNISEQFFAQYLSYRFDMNPPSLLNVNTTIESREGQKQVRFDLKSFPPWMIETSLG